MQEARQHTLPVNGIRMHVTEQGEGPLVLLVHGWPELGYSWRHQLPALARAGFRAVAPDMRGYGKTDVPTSIDEYTIFHLVGDLVALVEALGETRATVVGHDWGATVAWTAALLRPDVFPAVATMSVPYRGRGPKDPITMLRESGNDDYYLVYFQNPGVEAEFERDPTLTFRKVLYGVAGENPENLAMGVVPRGGGFLDRLHDPEQLPPWLSTDDLAFYAAEFTRTGFGGGLGWYRNLARNWELTAPFQGKRIEQPALFIAGARDPVNAGKRGQNAMRNMEVSVPNLTRVILEGAGHWIQQERPNEVNEALVTFLRRVTPPSAR